ncbi:MAG: hypothetical protein HN657_06895 [Candidatus Marinimicrobia bacterium]|jgi:lipopolysaccharide export LptBFGC system permease protein LptF|nr:hypothetical protein [Candidatus Neomarinimicrobiota bacterium]MBT3497129.1 hypothetical protein [Candidatus Neomarinimicrobiota bacterium]MBT3692773.1 hypothetical protein [Candidatus Neomarinimicrobiota bacterium]MBT3732608.1 hypothetical protein [Candidatus Neomarinimicrobiota bacterium]MBT4143879.1 hypothetical protein [Candidatus Neomarinimicrobiota bacterium]
MKNSIFIWVALISGVILLIPLIAMQFTSEVNWDYKDFIIMGVMLFTAGCLIVLTSRKFQLRQRVFILIIIVAIFLFIWVNGAVGIISK